VFGVELLLNDGVASGRKNGSGGATGIVAAQLMTVRSQQKTVLNTSPLNHVGRQLTPTIPPSRLQVQVRRKKRHVQILCARQMRPR